MTAVSEGGSGTPKDYFELFQIEPQFDVDIDDLGRRFRTLQRRFHPDRYAAAARLISVLLRRFQQISMPATKH